MGKIVDITGAPLEEEQNETEAEAKEMADLVDAFMNTVQAAKKMPHRTGTFIAMVGKEKGALMVSVTFHDEILHTDLINQLYPPKGNA